MSIGMITTLMGFGTAFYILWMMYKEIPILLKVKKKEWAKENERKHKQQIRVDKHNLEIKKTALEVELENEKAIFENNLKDEKNNIENENKIAISNIEEEYKHKLEVQQKLYEEEKVQLKKQKEYKSKISKSELQKANLEKGKRYEAFVAEYFRDEGYYVDERGKREGVKDSNIDIFLMNKEKAFFVQCKFYEKSTVDHNMVKATQTDIRNYMKINNEFTKLIKDRKKKILYVIPRKCLTKGAWTYIKENNDIIEYMVIPMDYK